MAVTTAPAVGLPQALSVANMQTTAPPNSIEQILVELQAATDALRAALQGAGTFATGGGGLGSSAPMNCTCGGTVANVQMPPAEPPKEPEAPKAEAPAPPPPPAPAAGPPKFPVDGGKPNDGDGFGATAGRKQPHGGVDINHPGGSAGKPILAMAAGKVVESKYNGGWGNTIVIEHANGFFTRYAHMEAISPHGVGAQINVGQEIGKIGNTGDSKGAHLHVEVMKGGSGVGNRVDPRPFLDGAASFA